MYCSFVCCERESGKYSVGSKHRHTHLYARKLFASVTLVPIFSLVWVFRRKTHICVVWSWRFSFVWFSVNFISFYFASIARSPCLIEWKNFCHFIVQFLNIESTIIVLFLFFAQTVQSNSCVSHLCVLLLCIIINIIVHWIDGLFFTIRKYDHVRVNDFRYLIWLKNNKLPAFSSVHLIIWQPHKLFYRSEWKMQINCSCWS